MYNVTQAYKTAIAAANIQSTIDIDIDGATYFAGVIGAGSFTITNQCTGSADITLGAVYLGQLSATLLIPTTAIGRNSWEGRTITPTYNLWTGTHYESLPLGVFVVAEATWTESGVKVVAYDYMRRFDKRCVFPETSAYPFDVLAIACSAAGVTLAHTREEVEAMPNGGRLFRYQPENDVKTWRDMLHYVAQLLCGFATINRAGELEIRQFGQTPVDTIGTGRREYSAKFSDYSTRYTAVEYTIIDTQEDIVAEAETNDGLTINLGSNPFLQDNGLTVEAAVQTILTAVGAMRYTPFKAAVMGNPAYDLGDAITFEGGRAGETATACMTYYKFTYHQRFELQGFGANPALAQKTARTKENAASTQAAIRSLTKRVNDMQENGLIFLLPYMISEDPIADGQRHTAVIFAFEVKEFRSPIAVHALFEADIDTAYDRAEQEYGDCRLGYTITLDGEDVKDWAEVIFTDGDHVLNIDIILPDIGQGEHELTIDLTPEGGDIA